VLETRLESGVRCPASGGSRGTACWGWAILALKGTDSKAQGGGFCEALGHRERGSESPERARPSHESLARQSAKDRMQICLAPLGLTAIFWGLLTQACAPLRPGLQDFAPLELGKRVWSLASGVRRLHGECEVRRSASQGWADLALKGTDSKAQGGGFCEALGHRERGSEKP